MIDIIGKNTSAAITKDQLEIEIGSVELSLLPAYAAKVIETTTPRR